MKAVIKFTSMMLLIFATFFAVNTYAESNMQAPNQTNVQTQNPQIAELITLKKQMRDIMQNTFSKKMTNEEMLTQIDQLSELMQKVVAIKMQLLEQKKQVMQQLRDWRKGKKMMHGMYGMAKMTMMRMKLQMMSNQLQKK